MRTKEEILKQMEETMPFEMIGKGQMPYILEAMDIYAQEVVKNNAVLPLVSGSASERYRKALGYISEATFEISIGTEKGSDVLEKALRIASGYNVD